MEAIQQAMATAFVALILAFVAFNLIVFVARRFLYVCAPNEILVFSGGRYPNPDGSYSGYKVVHGGRAWRKPFIERVDRMQLTTIPLEVTVTNAYSKGGIPLRVHAVANVKVSDATGEVKNAIERYLGRGMAEVQQVARENLEGNLRGIIAQLTPEEINEDRLAFAERLTEEAFHDLSKLGIQLDTFKIQAVSDEVNYLNSIGRPEIAEVIRKAEIAESDATREAEKVAADAKALADVAEAEADREIAQHLNALRTLDAELKAMVEAEQLKAKAAAEEARSLAEQELQEIRREREKVRLQADVVIPAEAERESLEMQARGNVAPIEARGLAQAEALRLLVEAWKQAGPDANQIYLINQLEMVARLTAGAVDKLHVQEIHLIDDGSGHSLTSLLKSFPMAMMSVTDGMRANYGIDIPGLIAKVSQGASSAPPPPEASGPSPEGPTG